MKTLIQGMCGINPNYALLVISAEDGLTSRTEEHFRLAFGMQVPVIVTLTKVDKITED
jgi:GTPase